MDVQEVEYVRLTERLPQGAELSRVEMNDSGTASEFEQQSGQGSALQSPDGDRGEPIPAAVFDEAGYLRLNPDVRRAIELGHIQSGYSHYLLHGIAEGRQLPDMPRESRNVMVASFGAAERADHCSELGADGSRLDR
jgi:hypothetical protein